MLNAEAHLTPQERAVFDAAVQRACDELGLGEQSFDVAKRERVARLIFDFICRGELDIDVVQRLPIPSKGHGGWSHSAGHDEPQNQREAFT